MLDFRLMTPADEKWMRLALEEARKGEGGTRPNPPVGAVLVRDGELLACGHHSKAGGLHAETDALRRAAALGADVAGATLYVTLEPCSTHGRVPPCTDAICAAKIARVVVGVVDRNPRHAGRGFGILRDAGIAVERYPEGTPLAAEMEAIVEPFFRHQCTGKPFVILKMAQTLDGAIADHAGVSKWITNTASRRAVAQLRRRSDVVLVGCGTVLADDPSLLRKSDLCEFPEEGLPGMRCVLDARGRIPATARIFTDGHASQTIVATSSLCPKETAATWRATGATVWELPLRFPAGTQEDLAAPELDLEALMRRMGEAGFLQVLCEGGSTLATAMVAQGLADEIYLFVAPKILGAGSLRTFGGQPFDLPTAPRFRITDVRNMEGDLLVRMRLEHNG